MRSQATKSETAKGRKTPAGCVCAAVPPPALPPVPGAGCRFRVPCVRLYMALKYGILRLHLDSLMCVFPSLFFENIQHTRMAKFQNIQML